MAKPRTSGVKGRTSETFNKARNERQKAVLLRYVARHEFDNGVAVRNASLALRAETLALCEQAEKLTRGGAKRPSLMAEDQGRPS